MRSSISWTKNMMCGQKARERLKGWRVEVQGNGDSGIARDTGC
jgi:hypothetical protein